MSSTSFATRPSSPSRRIAWLRRFALTLLIGLAGSMSCPGQAQEPTSAREASQPGDASKGDRVLRHAVFFKFKDGTTAAQVEKIVDAFRSLPGKIPTIRAFEWGTNNSPEGLDDGFTHCFVLSFANQQDLAEYAEHAAHQEFVDLVLPQAEGVFVCDYWTADDGKPVGRALRHAVFFQFKPEASAAQVTAIEEAFAALPGQIDAIADFEWGKEVSGSERADGFTHCFLVTFASEEARATYLPHESHQAFVGQLRPILQKVRVLDYWAEPAAR